MPDTQPAPLRLLLSASVPATTPPDRADAFVDALITPLLARGVRIITGGHPTLTPALDRAARALRRPHAIERHQLRRYLDLTHPHAAAAPLHLHGAATDPDAPGLAAELAALRDSLAARADAGLFAGGKGADSLTKPPGLRDELDRFRAAHPRAPVFFTAALGGYTADVLIPAARAGHIALHDGLTPAAREALWRATDPTAIAPLLLDALAAAPRP
ncbi:MAG: hypothetical protein H6705_05680 [Myxococcales bacterium]|nr:hypothetical protein [Myxococcales bacterium]